MSIKLSVNGATRELDIDPQMPLLWALRDHLQLTGTKFGCGMALCGACTVHIDGQATRSCVTPVAAAQGKQITTIEGLSTAAGRAVQGAWIGLDVPQCGYCQSGQVMSAAALLAGNPKPSDTISMPRWRATSAGAPPTCASAAPSIRPPRTWQPAPPRALRGVHHVLPPR